jgi:hypothetical protein
MANPTQLLTSVVNPIVRTMFFALAVVCTLISVGLPQAQAQTFSVLHNFTGPCNRYLVLVSQRYLCLWN